MSIKDRLAELQRKKEQDILTEDSVLTFGKYKGKSVKMILDMNPGYLLWMHKELDKKFSIGVIAEATLAQRELEAQRGYQGEGMEHYGSYPDFY